MRELILASTSPRRKEILEKSGIPFSVEDSGYEEDLTLKLEPAELAKHLALCKAEAVAKRHEDAIVIGADTIVVINGKVLGKPIDDGEAREMLGQLSGTVHTVVTGIAIIDAKNRQKITKAVETKVHFKQLTEKQIAEYIKTGESKGKAGAYAVQGLGAELIDKIEGDYYNVMGLPLSALLEELKGFGVYPVR